MVPICRNPVRGQLALKFGTHKLAYPMPITRWNAMKHQFADMKFHRRGLHAPYIAYLADEGCASLSAIHIQPPNSADDTGFSSFWHSLSALRLR